MVAYGLVDDEGRKDGLAGLWTLITVGKTWFRGLSINCLSRLAYCKSADFGGLAGGILFVMLLDVELPVLWPLVVLRLEGCLCVLMIVGLDEDCPSCWPSHSPCCLGKLTFTPALAAFVVVVLPKEEEEERREEIGGLELVGEVVDILVVAGITAGSSLSRLPAPL